MYQNETLNGGFLDFVNKQLNKAGSMVKETFKESANKILVANQNAAKAQSKAELEIAKTKAQRQKMMMWGGAAVGTVTLIGIALSTRKK